MNKTEKDVEKRILEKLGNWLDDSFALCETANIRNSAATAIVMKALMWPLILAMIKKGARKDDLLKVVSNNWDIVWKHNPRL